MKLLAQIAAWVAKTTRRLRNKATIAFFRFKGCDVNWAATINPDAIIERSGGKISIGPRTFIDKGVIIRAMGGEISIGSDCSVNAYSLLSGAGGLSISDDVMIASHVTIYASNHVFADTHTPMSSQGLTLQGVCVERDVWIGTGVRLLDGVVVGAGSVLAAGAVVTRTTLPYSINAGVPARQIGMRMRRSDL